MCFTKDLLVLNILKLRSRRISVLYHVKIIKSEYPRSFQKQSNERLVHLVCKDKITLSFKETKRHSWISSPPYRTRGFQGKMFVVFILKLTALLFPIEINLFF